MEVRLELFQEVGTFVRFLLLAKALFSLYAHCRTVFFLLDGKRVQLMGKHYPYCLLKVNIFKWG